MNIDKALAIFIKLLIESAARLITRTPRRDHISGEHRSLHWLRMHARCQFKLLTLIYKILHNMSPISLSDMIDWYTPTRTLRAATAPSFFQEGHKVW